DLFRGAGTVHHANVMIGRDGRSKGHGIVLYATIEDAKKAQEMFNGYEWHGRLLEVREDRSIIDFSPRKPIPSQPEDMNKLAEILDQKLNVHGVVEGREKTSNAADQDLTNLTDNHREGVNESIKGDSAIETPTTTNAAQRRTIHIGNIPSRVRWQDLKDLFRKAGRVIRADVILGPDNRSHIFGTVIFATEEEARNAIQMFDRFHWHDRVIHVQEARPGLEHGLHSLEGSQIRGTGSGPNYGGPFFRSPLPMNPNFVHGRQVFVGNLPFTCQWQDLKDLFRKAGDIIRADVTLGYDGRSRGFGSVLFATPEGARNAIAMFDGQEYNGRTLRVHYGRAGPMGHGPMIHGNMCPIMHPHPVHHPHLHHHPHHLHHPPHLPHHHSPHPLHHHCLHPPHHHSPHQLHPMHAQHGHGFPPNFHQPPMMPLGNHPMIPGPTLPGQVNIGPPPIGTSAFSSALLSPHSSHTPDISATDGSVEAAASPLSTKNHIGVDKSGDRAKSPSQFEASSKSPINISSPLIPSAIAAGSGHTATTVGPGPFTSGPGSLLHHPYAGSPSQYNQYPFLANLGSIGKTHPHFHPIYGALHNYTSEVESPTAFSFPSNAIPSSELEPTSVDNGILAVGNGNENVHGGDHAYLMNHSSNGTDKRGGQDLKRHDTVDNTDINSGSSTHVHANDTVSPGFYMYPGFFQNHQGHQPPQHQHFGGHDEHQQGYQQQPQPLGYPLYQDSYPSDQSHLAHSHSNLIGGLGLDGNTHEHGHGLGYLNQPDWVAHPNVFMMGPPAQHMYGLAQFGQYGGYHHGLGEEEEEEEEEEGEGKKDKERAKELGDDSQYLQANRHF
ncbi:hypothetical protein BX616_007344, partial [Lobosporangium transversale]